MKKLPKYLKKTYPILIVVATLIMGIGYASITMSLDIKGTAIAQAQKEILITNINCEQANAKINSYTKTIIDSEIELSDTDINSKVECKINITNTTNNNYAFKEIIYGNEFYDNQDIEVTTNIQKGTIINKNQTLELTLTFKYKENIREINNNILNTIINIKFEKYYTITYKNIINNNYPTIIFPNETIEITFINDIPNAISVSGTSNYNYEKPKLTITEPHDNITIDASKYTRNYDKLIFDGTNYIDTGIYLFSEENINKNFEISFDITNIESPQASQATLINSMEEISPYPGFVIRHTGNTTIEFNSPSIGHKNGINTNTLNKLLLKRYNDIYYIKMNEDNLIKLGKQETQTIFDVPLTIGASLDSDKNPWRFFKGTLSNVKIELTDPKTYIVIFDSNNETGITKEQTIRKEETTNLIKNTFENEGYVFDGWNTKKDGSGISYKDEQQVLDLANENETITLYAMWIQEFKYNICFNSNGGEGNMEEQEISYGMSVNLNENTFNKENRTFVGWNTESDGSGKDYKNKELVKNLTKTPNEKINLYAMWAEEYFYDEYEEFNGSNYIDTNIYLFNELNINKDFQVSFEIANRNSTGGQATIMSSMDETGSPWPGITYRITNQTQEEIVANVTTSNKIQTKYNRNDINKIKIKRRNGILYLSINDEEYTQVLNMTTLSTTFDVPLTFGSSLNSSGEPQRYFKGIVENMEVIVYE